MNRTSTILASSIVAGVLFTATAFAGMDYTQYRKQVEAQKEVAVSTDKISDHGNKYSRMQEEREVSASDSASTTSPSHNKYLDYRSR